MTTDRTATREDDHGLVREVGRGSESALAALYDRHADAIFGLAFSMTRDRSLAEEVVQETFLALWNRAEQFDPAIGSLAAWLSTIARNRTRDHLRWTARRIPSVPFSSMVGDRPNEAAAVEWLAAAGTVVAAGQADPSPDLAAVSAEERAAVVAALDVLTEDERRAVLLAYRDGLSQTEIAAVTGWPLGTVKTRSRRALRRLRASLEDEPQGVGTEIASPESIEIVPAMAAEPVWTRQSAPCAG
jgi:RNA polymerase sigma-70 factor (ECF subfamily)